MFCGYTASEAKNDDDDDDDDTLYYSFLSLITSAKKVVF